MKIQSLKAEYLKQLKRFAWKLQYHAKKIYRHERTLNDVWTQVQINEVDSKIFVEELLSSLPERGRYIIRKVVIEGLSEKEVARHLHISQKRVNVCKKRYLQQLSEKLTSTKERLL
ncbi:sigma factor-like helix-turn-helix DNA-binding protein [Brevibacillus borstelensis]|uniref:sigma factor-like helix-turn-helix DNA-binding protein n=1 Tax=Brevibacillus borstelensis TaxID=45462 RepID=UPI0030C1148B